MARSLRSLQQARVDPTPARTSPYRSARRRTVGGDWTSLLLEWLEHPHPSRGLTIPVGPSWERLPYATLADRVLRVADSLVSMGAQNSRVGIVVDDLASLVTALYAVLAAGATATVLPTARGLANSPAARARYEVMMRKLAPDFAIVDSEAAKTDSGAMAEPWKTVDISGLGSGSRASPVAFADPVVIHFTSGSTASPRGVMLRESGISAHLSSVAKRLGLRDDDGIASWLPLHHDMGLIGSLFLAVSYQLDLFLTTPGQFIRRPGVWASAFADAGATISAAPPFAFEYLARRLPPGALDLSGWRVAACGAEPIDPAALLRFMRTFASAGFESRALTPGYGLAEATLGVTWGDPRSLAPLLEIDPTALGAGHVSIAEQSVLDPSAKAPRDGHAWMVSAGAPLAGTSVSIRDTNGAVVEDGVVGQIACAGVHVAARYTDQPTPGFADGALATGDAGFLHEGQLYPVGRMGDRVKIRGTSVYMDEFEFRISRLTGVSGSQFRLVCLDQPGRPEIAVLAAPSATGPALHAARAVRRAIAAIVGVRAKVSAYEVPSRDLPRTTSGKFRRQRAWEMLQEGSIGRRLGMDRE